MLANGMIAIGSSDLIHNLPFCVEYITYRMAYLPVPPVIVSRKDELVSPDYVVSIIDEIIKRSCHSNLSHTFNIPIEYNNHTLLATIRISKDKQYELFFFDSIYQTNEKHAERYDPLQHFLSECFMFKLTDPYKVFHVLDQGDQSNGCGYYSLYTAKLLKDSSIEDLVNRSYEKPIYNEYDDIRIRAELVVRTMLDHGMENIDVSQDVKSLPPVAYRLYEHMSYENKVDVKQKLVRRIEKARQKAENASIEVKPLFAKEKEKKSSKPKSSITNNGSSCEDRMINNKRKSAQDCICSII